MEYIFKREEKAFEPEFGYGYLPPEDRPKKAPKTEPVRTFGKEEGEKAPERSGMVRPKGKPALMLLAALCILAVLLVMVLIASMNGGSTLSTQLPRFFA